MKETTATDLQYVVVATARDSGIRAAISGPKAYHAAELLKRVYAGNADYRKDYKYFSIAKHPYKSK